MTVHLKPPAIDQVIDAAQQPEPRSLSKAGAFIIHFGGGDRRATHCGGATVGWLVALGLVNLFISSGIGVLIGICSISLFELDSTGTTVAWCGGVCFGLITALINAAVMHGMFESYGMKQLAALRARREVPKLSASRRGLMTLRILISLILATSLMVPVKLTLTRQDQNAEIANEQNRRDLPQAKAAREGTDKKAGEVSKSIELLRLPVAALIFEKSMIETAQLGGDALSVPAYLSSHVRPELQALTTKAVALARQQREQEAARADELKLVRRLDQDVSFLLRRGERGAAAAASRKQAAAQQRAVTLTRQIATTTAEIAAIRDRLNVHLSTVQLQLGLLQDELKEKQGRLNVIEDTREQTIGERVQSSPGYQRISSGFIGRIESLARLWKNSPAARFTIAGIIGLIALLDLIPLLMKAAIKLPAYALRIASDSQRSFANEAAATVSADIQFMRLTNQLEAELDNMRKVQHQRSAEWYRNYPPLAWIRLVAAASLLRRGERPAEPTAPPRQAVSGQAA